MELRTYYWYDRVFPSLFRLIKIIKGDPSRYFKTGNSGDIYAKEILSHVYNIKVKNVKSSSNRILCVGSISHLIQEGDVLCGIGYKGGYLPKPNNNLVWGVRGPLTLEALRKARYDVSNVKFMFDPGLCIKELYNISLATEAGKVLFIPHYRERYSYKCLPKGVELLDIDNHPQFIAEKIARADLVYSSSLHGIIFSHSLGVPCVYVKPKTEEPHLKYEDYFLSVGISSWKEIDNIEKLNFARDLHSPYEAKFKIDDLEFPDLKFLQERKIVV